MDFRDAKTFHSNKKLWVLTLNSDVSLMSVLLVLTIDNMGDGGEMQRNLLKNKKNQKKPQKTKNDLRRKRREMSRQGRINNLRINNRWMRNNLSKWSFPNDLFWRLINYWIIGLKKKKIRKYLLNNNFIYYLEAIYHPCQPLVDAIGCLWLL